MTRKDGKVTGIGLIDRAKGYADRTAILSGGIPYSYADLLRASEEVAWRLLQDSGDLKEERIQIISELNRLEVELYR